MFLFSNEFHRGNILFVIISFIFYPFKPVVATPSTKYFWAAKKMITQGSMAISESAIIGPHEIPLELSIHILSPCITVYLLTLLIKINGLKILLLFLHMFHSIYLIIRNVKLMILMELL